MVNINVYLYDKKQEHFFSGKSTSKNVCGIICNIQNDFSFTKSKLKSESDRDNFLISSLKQADSNGYTLICMDKMISSCSSEQIYNCVEYCIQNICFDILYLSSWMDRGDMYDDIHDYCGYKIVKTISSHGTACLLFSPQGRRIFLENVLLVEGKSIDMCLEPQLYKFKAYTTNPSIINFNILERENDLEYCKVSKCREVPNSVRPVEITRRNTSTLNLLWFILVLIIIICITCILLSYAETNKITYDSITNSLSFGTTQKSQSNKIKNMNKNLSETGAENPFNPLDELTGYPI
jgi:hypothetical protein